jgi:hypothetical protein
VAISFITFLKVSDIDQPLRNSEEHDSFITDPPSANIGDRELVMLPPNAGKHRAFTPTILDCD